MRSGTAQRQDSATGVTRRVVRLLVLLGAVVGAYLLLSLLSHAARADVGSTDHMGASDAVASAKTTGADAAGATAAGAKKVIPKRAAPKVHPLKIHRPTSKTPPKVRASEKSRTPKIQATRKVHTSKVRAPKKVQLPKIRAGETAHRVQARTSKLHRTSSGAVRNVVRATVTPARTAVVRQKLRTSAQLPSLPELRDLPQAALASWTRLPDLPRSELPGLPHAQIPAWPHVPGVPPVQLPAWPHLPGLPLAPTTVFTSLRSDSAPHQPLMAPVSARVCPLPQSPAFAPAVGLSGVTKPPAAQAEPLTAPLPAPPRQPADRSTTAGQARDSGGGNAPAMGTVPSSWRPEVAAAGRRLATDLIARGRTLRYAGPPS
jgi:hypothetical protein